MLTLVVNSKEFFDDTTQTFIVVDKQTLNLEHSLISISRWESKWMKPYLSKNQKTKEEITDYICCMSINRDISSEVVQSLSQKQLKQIDEYIRAPMTATTFAKDGSPPSNRIITSEVIYGQMVSLNISFECQKWHFNRLMTLIQVCALQNQQPKKMSKGELNSRNRQLNQARRAQHNTRG